MEVILVEDVRKLGKVGDTVKVKPGYARNYLIPGSKALYATKSNIEYFAAKKAEIEKENQKKLEEAKKLGKKVDGQVVSIIRQAAEDGRLYGSVTAGDIANALQEGKIEILKRQVVLSQTIKAIGIYQVEVDLHSELDLKVSINVARSEEEAKEAVKKFKKGGYEATKPVTEVKQKSYEEILAENEPSSEEGSESEKEVASADDQPNAAIESADEEKAEVPKA